MSDSDPRDGMSAAALPRIDIAEALRNRWFEAWYQPKVDLKRKCLAGAEMLARIRHPDLGVLLPGSFQPELDEQSLVDLSEHGLVTSLSDWTTFAEAGFELHLAINVPVRALLKLPITQLVSDHRPKSERWPGLILEVIEDHIIRDIELANAIAEQLRDSGITIAIDNFGAGNSSLASLHELPITELKIASSFTRNCATDPAQGAICRTAIDLAHGAGSVAAADGIESALDMQSLMVMGCDFAQGPLIAPFLPKQEFLDLLRQRNAPRPISPRDVIQSGAPPIGRVA